MAILTLKGHISRALDFMKRDDIYFAIGKSTPWDENSVSNGYDSSVDYESYPPVPRNIDDILEIIGYKKAEFKSLVVQDPDGQLEYRSTKWKIVSDEDAYTEGARWVYISTTLSYNELPTDKPYRQLGVFTGLKRLSGVDDNKYVLLPDDVDDSGILEILDNRKPVYRDNDVRERIKIIVEF